ncbi:MAG: transcriptional regulator [Candidatus Thiodiazotropha sp. (ex Epidulcina cf. delphinae)]|nr:transcriptional regulator [Candidatus Thiodiazotropha sp. (ex Epidulcina cf. delphinae)]
METAALSRSLDHTDRTWLESFLPKWRRWAGVLSMTGFSLLLLYMGWLNRSEAVWTAEEGWGYWLGITGGSLMLLLLLYPMRKRIRGMLNWSTVKFWFRLHMVFGVLGPVLIMMHSSYRLGSLNGRVALFSMLIVAVSGLIGRYFYTRIHYGLYGRKATFASLHTDSEALKKRLGRLFELRPKSKELLKQYEQQVMEAPKGMVASAGHWFTMRLISARLYPSVMHSLNKKLLAVAHSKGWDKAKVHRNQLRIKHLLLSHRNILRQILEIHFYERLFAIWHVLHMPLFIMMVITGFVHVYAVHAY